MPRSRSRSPRPPRDDRDRRHRSRRYGDDEPERQQRSRRDEDDGRRRGDRGGGRRDREQDRGDRESGGRDRESGGRDRGGGRGDREGGRGNSEGGRGDRGGFRGERGSGRDPGGKDYGRSSREKGYGRERGYGGDKEETRGSDERIVRRTNNPGTGANSIGPGTGANADDPEAPPVEKEKENFGNTGLLAAATNTVNGVVLKYSEPSEARKPPPSQKWRLFVFKDKEIVDNIDLNTNSCWLVGRDRAVADLAVDHPSCSKQHAVVQFRHVTKAGEFGDKESSVKPYILDLESANGTWVGRDKMPERRYVELKEGDLIKFGLSTREYVLMLEKD